MKPAMGIYIRVASSRSQFRPTSTSTKWFAMWNVMRYGRIWSPALRSGDGRAWGDETEATI